MIISFQLDLSVITLQFSSVNRLMIRAARIKSGSSVIAMFTTHHAVLTLPKLCSAFDCHPNRGSTGNVFWRRRREECDEGEKRRRRTEPVEAANIEPGGPPKRYLQPSPLPSLSSPPFLSLYYFLDSLVILQHLSLKIHIFRFYSVDCECEWFCIFVIRGVFAPGEYIVPLEWFPLLRCSQVWSKDSHIFVSVLQTMWEWCCN